MGTICVYGQVNSKVPQSQTSKYVGPDPKIPNPFSSKAEADMCEAQTLDLPQPSDQRFRACQTSLSALDMVPLGDSRPCVSTFAPKGFPYLSPTYIAAPALLWGKPILCSRWSPHPHWLPKLLNRHARHRAEKNSLVKDGTTRSSNKCTNVPSVHHVDPQKVGWVPPSDPPP
jgi:hypothetical protein